MKTTVFFSTYLDRRSDDETFDLRVEVEAEVTEERGRVNGPPEDCYPDETLVEILSVTRAGCREAREQRRVEVELDEADEEYLIDEAIRNLADYS